MSERRHSDSPWGWNGPDRRTARPPAVRPREPGDLTEMKPDALTSKDWPWCVMRTACGLEIWHSHTGERIDIYEAAHKLNAIAALRGAAPHEDARQEALAAAGHHAPSPLGGMPCDCAACTTLRASAPGAPSEPGRCLYCDSGLPRRADGSHDTGLGGKVLHCGAPSGEDA